MDKDNIRPRWNYKKVLDGKYNNAEKQRDKEANKRDER
jgi:hypothetical protein